MNSRNPTVLMLLLCAAFPAIAKDATIEGRAVLEKPAVWLDQSPTNYAKKFKTPMLVSVGENDFRVPLNNALVMQASDLVAEAREQGVFLRLQTPGRGRAPVGDSSRQSRSRRRR